MIQWKVEGRGTAGTPTYCQPTVSATATTMRVTPVVRWNHLGRREDESWCAVSGIRSLSARLCGFPSRVTPKTLRSDGAGARIAMG